MDISDEMIRYYLGYVTVSYFGRHDDPPDNAVGYHDYVMDMKKSATKHGDLEALRLAFEYFLGNRGADQDAELERLGSTRWAYDAEDLREIIGYAHRTIWPDAGPVPPGGPPGVRIVRMSLEDWWAQRDKRKPEGP